MRMWMVDPAIMCRQHLLGEHVECHMILSTLRAGKSISGYIKNNCVEPHSIKIRHDQLFMEMKNRGYNHQSEMILLFGEPFIFPDVKIDRDQAKNLLFGRCESCRR